MAVSRPPVSRMLGRALVLHCPWCGGRRTFVRRWLGKYERCRTCGIRWRREEGFELGPVTINTIITFLVLTVVMTTAFIVTLPDTPVLPLVLVCGAIAIVLPIVLYPFTYTVWLVLDLVARPPDAAELADAVSALEPLEVAQR
jgi:uncharacterized protein (DUF983 family)